MNTTWKITQTDYQTSDGFISCAHWTATAVDGDYTASIYSTASWQAGTPTITAVSPLEVDSTAGGNITFTITGSNFQSGAVVKFIGSDATEITASTTTVTNSTTISAVIARSSFVGAKEPYDVRVVNSSGLSGTLDNQINVDVSPTWSTASGTLTTITDKSTGTHVTVSATDADGDTVSYSETGGTVLTTAGLTLNSSTGAISGDPTDVASSTTYSFTLRATANSKTVDRAFNIIVNSTLDGTMRLRGYAAVFNDASVPLPFKETIAPGAFRKTLSETPDVRLLINHEGLPLARTKNGTLTLSEDERGLFMDAEIADTTEGRDLYKLVERGDVDQMSFAFRVIRQKWNEDRSVRTLTEVSLADGDVSVVTYPAYPTTTVEAREALKNAMDAIKEGRALDGESTLVINSILEKVSESYDSLDEGKTMLEVLLGLNTLEPTVEVEEPEVELEPTDMPATAGRSISLRLAKAIINNTK